MYRLIHSYIALCKILKRICIASFFDSVELVCISTLTNVQMSVLKETAVWSRDFSLNKQWLPDCALRRKRLNASDVRFLDVFSGSACSWQLHEIQNIVKMIRDYSRWLLHVRLFCVVRVRNLTSEEEVDELYFPEDELFFNLQTWSAGSHHLCLVLS